MLNPAAEDWEKRRTFHHSLYPAARIAAEREGSVSVCLPARECGATIGEIVSVLSDLRRAGAIDEIVVVDAASADGTAQIAADAGAKVVQEGELMRVGESAQDGGSDRGDERRERGSAQRGERPELGPVLGKGDAMWRALSVLEGELVVFLDADSAGFSGHFATGLIGPIVCEPEVQFVKAFYRRPFEYGGISLPEGGGRVNHLLARPALALFYPQLGAVRQPLAGEVAARRELLERVPFATGYSVEIAMLIDVWREVGLDGLAQVDLEVHRNRHQSLGALGEMSERVLATIARRLHEEKKLSQVDLSAAPVERPAFAAFTRS
ncbi:MAG: glucosyl-3-phosphoglycerate synthase [Solirubrobacteraceae bacterium]